jgi:hypothetical protein
MNSSESKLELERVASDDDDDDGLGSGKTTLRGTVKSMGFVCSEG